MERRELVAASSRTKQRGCRKSDARSSEGGGVLSASPDPAQKYERLCEPVSNIHTHSCTIDCSSYRYPIGLARFAIQRLPKFPRKKSKKRRDEGKKGYDESALRVSVKLANRRIFVFFSSWYDNRTTVSSRPFGTFSSSLTPDSPIFRRVLRVIFDLLICRSDNKNKKEKESSVYCTIIFFYVNDLLLSRWVVYFTLPKYDSVTCLTLILYIIEDTYPQE